jgi:hypothetical protein
MIVHVQFTYDSIASEIGLEEDDARWDRTAWPALDTSDPKTESGTYPEGQSFPLQVMVTEHVKGTAFRPVIAHVQVTTEEARLLAAIAKRVATATDHRLHDHVETQAKRG